jgi:amidase
MTDAEIQAFQDYRANYRSILASWMDAQGVDAVVFPGELSDIHLNDSIQPSFGRLDPQASAAGVPTVIFPAGVNDHGQPINLQLEGRAYSDPTLVGYAYAFEAKANGQVLPTAVTPKLTYQPGVETVNPVAAITPAPTPVSTPVPGSPAPISEGTTPTYTLPPSPSASTGFRKLTVISRKPVAGRKGAFKVVLGCASQAKKCTGELTVKRGGGTVLSKPVTIGAGRTVTVKVIPSKPQVKKIKKGKKLSFRITVAGTSSTHDAKATTVTIQPH